MVESLMAIRQSSENHQKVIRKLSESHQKIIRKSLESHQTIILDWSILLKKLCEYKIFSFDFRNILIRFFMARPDLGCISF